MFKFLRARKDRRRVAIMNEIRELSRQIELLNHDPQSRDDNSIEDCTRRRRALMLKLGPLNNEEFRKATT